MQTENKTNEVAILPFKKMDMESLSKMSKVFAMSGTFKDATSAAQAFVKIQAGQEIGIEPFAAMAGIYMIQGKPQIGANIIASRIKSSLKYNYKVRELSDEICVIDFLEDGLIVGESIFTIEDAKKAKTQNTDKFPRNMLFARAISNGYRWHCPDVLNCSVYVEGEFTDYVEENEPKENKELERLRSLLYGCDTTEQLKKLFASCKTSEEIDLYNDVLEEFEKSNN